MAMTTTTLSRALPLLVLFLVLVGSAAASLTVTDEERAEDERRVDAAFEALASGSAEAFAGVFAEGGEYEWEGNGTTSKGRGAVRASWAPALERWTLAVRARRAGALLYPEPAEDECAPPAGERTVRFMAAYAYLGVVPKKRTHTCTGVQDSHALETVTFGADGLVRRWSSLQAWAHDDVRRKLKCLGHQDPDVHERNVPCFEISDRVWSLLAAQRSLGLDNAGFYFSGALPDGAFADDEPDDEEAASTFEGQTYDGAAGAVRLLKRMLKGVAQLESHFEYGPFCPESDENVSAMSRTIFLAGPAGCSTSVRSVERLRLNNNKKISHWDVIWDKPLEQVRRELDCGREPRETPRGGGSGKKRKNTRHGRSAHDDL